MTLLCTSALCLTVPVVHTHLYPIAGASGEVGGGYIALVCAFPCCRHSYLTTASMGRRAGLAVVIFILLACLLMRFHSVRSADLEAQLVKQKAAEAARAAAERAAVERAAAEAAAKDAAEAKAKAEQEAAARAVEEHRLAEEARRAAEEKVCLHLAFVDRGQAKGTEGGAVGARTPPHHGPTAVSIVRDMSHVWCSTGRDLGIQSRGRHERHLSWCPVTLSGPSPACARHLPAHTPAGGRGGWVAAAVDGRRRRGGGGGPSHNPLPFPRMSARPEVCYTCAPLASRAVVGVACAGASARAQTHGSDGTQRNGQPPLLRPGSSECHGNAVCLPERRGVHERRGGNCRPANIPRNGAECHRGSGLGAGADAGGRRFGHCDHV